MKYIGRSFSFLNIAREMRIGPIKEAAEEAVHIGIVGPAIPRVEQVLRLLGGARAVAAVQERTLIHLKAPLAGASTETLARCHLVIVIGAGDRRQLIEEVSEARLHAGPTTPLIWLLFESFWGEGAAPGSLFDPGGPQRILVVAEGRDEELRLKLTRAVVELAPNVIGTARRLPPLRPLAAQRLVNETSRANAEFAAFSNLPALLPVVGNLFAAAADLIVLTKNQIWMIYKLAAVYGRDLRMGVRLIIEIAPVVGGAFVWRTIARELAALLPGLLGAVPKILVAYTGTYVVGKSADYYYREGRKPPKTLMQDFYHDAIARVKNLKLRDRLPGRRKQPAALLPAPTESTPAAGPSGEPDTEAAATTSGARSA